MALVIPTHEVVTAAAAALDGATKTLRREAEQRRKDAAKADRAEQRRRDDADKTQRENRMTLKSAVFEVMPEAKRLAGRVVDIRTLFYKVRPLIQKLGVDRELAYDYFTQTLVPEYQRTVAPLPGLYYEARGELHHPHDGTVVKLGTREVAAYIPPKWQFNKILYVEKTGLAEQLAHYQFGQRYDMAIIYGKGFAVEACRTLLARSDIRDMQIFVLHDADDAGYNIARTLGEATERMPDHHIDVIDLGLTVPQAIGYGLETEEYTRRKALPADLELDPQARRWFTGTPFSAGWGKTHYRCIRCELNAFSADELAAHIEAGLQSHGATTKVVPPPDVLADRVARFRDARLADLVWSEMARKFNVAAVVRQLVADHPDLAEVDEARIRDDFTDNPTRSWLTVADQLVDDDIDDAEGITDAIREQITQQLNGAADD